MDKDTEQQQGKTVSGPSIPERSSIQVRTSRSGSGPQQQQQQQQQQHYHRPAVPEPERSSSQTSHPQSTLPKLHIPPFSAAGLVAELQQEQNTPGPAAPESATNSSSSSSNRRRRQRRRNSQDETTDSAAVGTDSVRPPAPVTREQQPEPTPQSEELIVSSPATSSATSIPVAAPSVSATPTAARTPTPTYQTAPHQRQQQQQQQPASPALAAANSPPQTTPAPGLETALQDVPQKTTPSPVVTLSRKTNPETGLLPTTEVPAETRAPQGRASAMKKLGQRWKQWEVGGQEQHQHQRKAAAGLEAAQNVGAPGKLASKRSIFENAGAAAGTGNPGVTSLPLEEQPQEAASSSSSSSSSLVRLTRKLNPETGRPSTGADSAGETNPPATSAEKMTAWNVRNADPEAEPATATLSASGSTSKPPKTPETIRHPVAQARQQPRRVPFSPPEVTSPPPQAPTSEENITSSRQSPEELEKTRADARLPQSKYAVRRSSKSSPTPATTRPGTTASPRDTSPSAMKTPVKPPPPGKQSTPQTAIRHPSTGSPAEAKASVGGSSSVATLPQSASTRQSLPAITATSPNESDEEEILESSGLGPAMSPALLFSPASRPRNRFPPGTSMGSYISLSDLEQQQRLWRRLINLIRRDMELENMETLNELDRELRDWPPSDMNILNVNLEGCLVQFGKGLHDDNLPTNVRQQILHNARTVAEKVHTMLVGRFAEYVGRTKIVTEDLCNIMETAAMDSGDEDELLKGIDKYPVLNKKKMMKKRKEDIVDMCIKRDAWRVQDRDADRDELGRMEERLQQIEDENLILKKDLYEERLHRRELGQKEVEKRIDEMKAHIVREGNKESRCEAEHLREETRRLREEIKELEGKRRRYKTPRPSPPPQPPSAEELIDEDPALPTLQEAQAAAAQAEFETKEKQRFRQMLMGTLTGYSTLMDLSRIATEQMAGVDYSGPPSERSPLMSTPSSSNRNFPSQSDSASIGNGGPSTLLGQQTLLDEMAFDDLATGSSLSVASARPSSERSVPMPANPVPREPRQEPKSSVVPDIFEENEPQQPKTDVSVKTLAILAGFVEKSAMAPTGMFNLIERLLQLNGMSESLEPVQSASKRLQSTAIGMQRDKPTALPSHAPEQAPVDNIDEFIADAEPYLDRFIELFVHDTRSLTALLPPPPPPRLKDSIDDRTDVLESTSGGMPIYPDPEWLLGHPNGPCPECMLLLDFEAHFFNLDNLSDTTDRESTKEEEGSNDDEDEEAEQVQDEYHRSTSIKAHVNTSICRGVTSPDSTASREGSTGGQDLAKRQLRPHSITECSKESTSTRSSWIPPSQIGSPTLEVPDLEDAASPNAFDARAGPAKRDIPELRGGMLMRGPRFYVCRKMYGDPVKDEFRLEAEEVKEAGSSGEAPKPDGEPRENTQLAHEQQTDTEQQPPEQEGPVEKQPSVDGNVHETVCNEPDLGDRYSGPQPAPELWRQLLVLLCVLIRWLTLGQLVNFWITSVFVVSLMKYCSQFILHEGASGVLGPDLRRRSLRPLQAPEIPRVAVSSLCLWLLLAWNTAMLVSMKEERRLWLAANPRTASYLRGLSGRYPYPWWSPVEVDYALLQPAWNEFCVWLHGIYFRDGLSAWTEKGYAGGYLADRAKVALMHVGIEERQDVLRVISSMLKRLFPWTIGFYAVRELLDWAAAGSLGRRARHRVRT